MEPVLPIRQWRVINDFACGPESWGMADYRMLIDQLAKLKFNRIFISIWPWQPFLHYEVRGVQRQSATLWFDFHYPITDDMVGRHLFGDEVEFWNPDLPRDASYQAFRTAGDGDEALDPHTDVSRTDLRQSGLPTCTFCRARCTREITSLWAQLRRLLDGSLGVRYQVTCR